MPAFVSILIPCYNAGRWLAETLESALAQTWPHREIIVVDDGSKDDSRAVAHRFAPRGVTVIEQANAGQSAAFNTAIRAARGDYYEFLDADDLLAPDKIERQVARLAQLPTGWMATGGWARFRRDPAEAVFRAGPVSRDLTPLDWVLALWNSDSMMHGAAWLVPAPLVASAGGWNPSLSLINDFEFFSRLVLASPGVAHCAEAKTYYRSGLDGSLSGQRSARAWRSAFESVRLGTERVLATENSPRTRAACATVWRNLTFDAYPDAPPELRQLGERRVRELGGRLGRPVGGRWFTLTSRLLGWKFARRLQAARRRR
jgi:glycosyltransferase involved in cell wall biosynthesis